MSYWKGSWNGWTPRESRCDQPIPLVYCFARYKKKMILGGVIYLHGIYSNPSQKSLASFCRLCDDATFSMVALVTTKWDIIPNEEGESYEEQLKDKWWKSTIEKGCSLYRSQNYEDILNAF